MALEPGEQRALSAHISMAPLTARTREALLASPKPTWRQTARHSPYAVPIRTCGQPRHHSCPLGTARSHFLQIRGKLRPVLLKIKTGLEAQESPHFANGLTSRLLGPHKRR